MRIRIHSPDAEEIIYLFISSVEATNDQGQMSRLVNHAKKSPNCVCKVTGNRVVLLDLSSVLYNSNNC